jgi:Holliday junction resolvase RusA-like endonuclease
MLQGNREHMETVEETFGIGIVEETVGIGINGGTLLIDVRGKQRPAGSKRAFVYTPKGGGRPRALVVDANPKAGEWKQDVRYTAQKAIEEQSPSEIEWPCEAPVSVMVTFYVTRPKSHYNSKGALRPNAPRFPTSKPDATKLWRGTEDALTGIVWKDDAQVVGQLVRKVYSDSHRTLIHVVQLSQQQ